MVGAGTLMGLLLIYALLQVMGENIQLNARMSKFFLWAIALPYLANSFGWIMTEVGRYPWAVQGLLKIEDAVSTSVAPGAVLFSLIGYVLIYGILMVVDVSLLVKYAKIVPEGQESAAAD